MTGNSEWPALLADYKAIVERFDTVSRALGEALARPGEANGHLSALLAEEAQPGTLSCSRGRA
jgi:hypothetical protein